VGLGSGKELLQVALFGGVFSLALAGDASVLVAGDSSGCVSGWSIVLGPA